MYVAFFKSKVQKFITKECISISLAVIFFTDKIEEDNIFPDTNKYITSLYKDFLSN